LLINQVDNLIPNDHAEGHGEISMITHVQPSNEWNNFRGAKANKIFADYQARRDFLLKHMLNIIFLTSLCMLEVLPISY
jgi:hypothetical protein